MQGIKARQQKTCKMSSDLNTERLKVALWQNTCLNFCILFCKILKDKSQGFNNELGLFQHRLTITAIHSSSPAHKHLFEIYFSSDTHNIVNLIEAGHELIGLS